MNLSSTAKMVIVAAATVGMLGAPTSAWAQTAPVQPATTVAYGEITYYYADSSLTGPAVGTFASDLCNQIDYGYQTSYYRIRYVTCSSVPR